MVWRTRRGRGVFTFHQALLDNLAEALHVGLGQVLALLGLLEPFVGARALCQAGRAWLRDVVVFAHGGVAREGACVYVYIYIWGDCRCVRRVGRRESVGARI